MPKTRKTMKRKTMKKRWGGASKTSKIKQQPYKAPMVGKPQKSISMKDLQLSLYDDVEASLQKKPRAAVLKARLTSASIRKNKEMKSSNIKKKKEMKQKVDDLTKMFKNL